MWLLTLSFMFALGPHRFAGKIQREDHQILDWLHEDSQPRLRDLPDLQLDPGRHLRQVNGIVPPERILPAVSGGRASSARPLFCRWDLSLNRFYPWPRPKVSAAYDGLMMVVGSALLYSSCSKTCFSHYLVHFWSWSQLSLEMNFI